MNEMLAVLNKKGINFLLSSYSALDMYFRVEEPGPLFINTDANLVTLAVEFDDINYPGFPFVDAVVNIAGNPGEIPVFFRCVDNIKIPFPAPFTVLEFLYDAKQQVFFDPSDMYRHLRQTDLVLTDRSFSPLAILMEASKLVSRYQYEFKADDDKAQSPGEFRFKDTALSPEIQKELLTSILLSREPWKGLSLLEKTGFIESYWPVLFLMCKVKHTKDYHPEGDVWEHTLEVFKYRKKADLTLSLALLLHDIGKPHAIKTATNPFHDHSELGVRVAQRFLSHLGFSEEIRENVAFLIRYHMIPWALKKLPIYRTEKLMDSPLFPLLLELYRADISSTFKGPESYYDACRIYKNYIKDKRINSYYGPQYNNRKYRNSGLRKKV